MIQTSRSFSRSLGVVVLLPIDFTGASYPSLQKLGIRTIGQLAESDEKLLESHFGKIGNVLWAQMAGMKIRFARKGMKLQ